MARLRQGAKVPAEVLASLHGTPSVARASSGHTQPAESSRKHHRDVVDLTDEEPFPKKLRPSIPKPVFLTTEVKFQPVRRFDRNPLAYSKTFVL